MVEQQPIVNYLDYIEVVNNVDLQICMTGKSMLEFDRMNPCFYLKVSYNEETNSTPSDNYLMENVAMILLK